ncbi:unnamed protein product [Dicrocoelium dendriticum]|nr:unnamed protein product [Dicrocoelium dendriticum]
MNLSLTCLLSLFLSVQYLPCFTGVRMLGGFTNPCAPSEEQQLIYLPILQAKLAADGSTHLNPSELLSVSTQVVAGTNYKFVVKFNEDTCTELEFYQSLGEPLHTMRSTGSKTVPCIQPLLQCRPI